LIGSWIDSRQVWTLVPIAVMAGQREVRWLISPQVLPRDNVLDMEIDKQFVILMDLTILATIVRPFSNQFPYG
jgi:hypothetical protein